MFEIDDHVIYGNHGVCKVEKIGPVVLPMADKNKIYYTLRPVYKQESVVYAPVENPKAVLRPVMSKTEAEQLICEIPQIDAVWISNEKDREVQYRAALKTCDCRELIRIIKAISQRKVDRIKDGKKVTVVDDRYFKQAEEQLYGELAFVLAKDKKEMSGYIASSIG